MANMPDPEDDLDTPTTKQYVLSFPILLKLIGQISQEKSELNLEAEEELLQVFAIHTPQVIVTGIN